MTIATAQSDINAKIAAEWPAIEPTVPIAHPNPLEQVNSNVPEYLLVDIVWIKGDFITIGAPGNNRVRRDGTIWLHAFIPAGKGSVRALQIAAAAARIFEGQDFGQDGIVCWAMEPGGGQSGTVNGNWFGQSVSVPFFFDEFA